MIINKDNNTLLKQKFDLNELKEKSFNLICENWICTKKKEELEWIDFNGKKSLDNFPFFQEDMVILYYGYISCIYENWQTIVKHSNYNELSEELCYIEIEGVACIYTSVLLYMLIKKYDERLVKDLRLIQGFYHHLLRSDFSSILSISKHQQGLHSFLDYKSSVIDCTAFTQNQHFFNFDSRVIFGDKPNGFDLYGYAETEETILKYAERFSKINFNSIDEWLYYHQLILYKIMNNE